LYKEEDLYKEDETYRWSSLYIPMLIVEEDALKEIMSKMGEISRIDYVNKKVGVKTVSSAYVHFKKWYRTSKTIEIRNKLDKTGEFKYVVEKVYLVLKINHKPIQAVSSSLNIHQMGAKVEYFEKENGYLKNVVCDMQKELYFLRKKYTDACGMSLPWVHAMERRLTADEGEEWRKNAKSIYCDDESVEYFLPSVIEK